VTAVDYFLVMPHPAYTDAPRLLNFHEKLNMNDFYLDRSQNIPPRTVIQVHPNTHMDFTDYLFQSVPLISDQAMRIIWQYDTDFLCKSVILLSTEDSVDQLYHLPFFPRFAANVIKTPVPPLGLEYAEDVPELLLPYALPLFYVMENHQCLLFMRLDLMESLLRNNARGMAVKKVIVRTEG
jgi:hypothetical protein